MAPPSGISSSEPLENGTKMASANESSSSVDEATNAKFAPNPKLPSIEEIRAAVPKECFEKPLSRSLYYLALDLVVIAGLYCIVPLVEAYFGWVGLLAWYWVLGMYLFALFVIGHDCGHGTFSEHRWINDLFGNMTHGLILAPFWPWQKSHRHHHQFTGHLDKDKGHPWKLETDFDQGSWLYRNFTKIPFFYGLIAWNPVYTVLGLPDGSHFWPWSRLFTNNWERLQCVVSGAACLFTSFVIFSFLNYSPLAFLKYYYVPVLFQGFWLVIITYLQHQDEQIEVYEEGTWAFVRGQLQTIDRYYGFGIDTALHHITDGHVAHHFFFTRIPHYNLPRATRAIRELLEAKYPGAYKRRSAYHFLPLFLWLNLKLDCLVGRGTGLLKYRSTVRREGKTGKEE